LYYNSGSSYSSSRQISVNKNSYTYSAGDIAIVNEIGLMSDNIYVLLTGTYSNSEYSPTSTSLVMNYTYENFKNSGETFVYSKTNQLQFYKANLGYSGTIKLESQVGNQLLSTSYLVLFQNPFSIESFFKGNYLLASFYGSVYGFEAESNGYIAFFPSSCSAPMGSVLKLTITPSNINTNYLITLFSIVGGIATGVVATMFILKMSQKSKSNLFVEQKFHQIESDDEKFKWDSEIK
jgi:hypothetical protein